LGLVPAVLWGSAGWWLAAVVTYLALQTFAVGIGTHRLFTHRAFQTSRAKEIFLSYFSMLHMLGSPISWVAVHALHHETADTENDPHSPHQIAWWKIWFSTYYDGEMSKAMRYVRPMLRDRHHVFVHRNYFKLALLWQTLLLLIGWKVYLFIFCVPTVLVYNITTLGTVAHHVFGYRTYDTVCESRNNWLLSLLTAGDGWHNNHHWNPRSLRHGEKWWEIDLQAWLIERIFAQTDGDKQSIAVRQVAASSRKAARRMNGDLQINESKLK
jgi:stearoyl-CoA desaturase (delta-9 desaturase)